MILYLLFDFLMYYIIILTGMVVFDTFNKTDRTARYYILWPIYAVGWFRRELREALKDIKK